MIRNIESGQLLTARQLAERLANAAYVLVGEQHGNPDHQALELWLLQALGDQRPQGSLLLGMLGPRQQARVHALHAEIGRANYPADLPAALHWQAGWDWSTYGPMVRFALSRPFPLLAAGLDAEEAVTECSPSVASQRRLYHMARSLLAAPAPALLFAAAEQVRKDTGVPAQMAGVDPSRVPVVLLLARSGEVIEPGVADYVWYTAALPEPLSR